MANEIGFAVVWVKDETARVLKIEITEDGVKQYKYDLGVALATSEVNSTDTSNGHRLSWAWKFAENITSTSITVEKPSGLVLWGMTANQWTTTGAPYKGWATSVDMPIVELCSNTQQRLGIGLVQSRDTSVTFKPAYSAPMTIGYLTVQGIDKFYTATTHTWLE